jgi:hypothetical protein
MYYSPSFFILLLFIFYLLFSSNFNLSVSQLRKLSLTFLILLYIQKKTFIKSNMSFTGVTLPYSGPFPGIPTLEQLSLPQSPVPPQLFTRGVQELPRQVIPPITYQDYYNNALIALANTFPRNRLNDAAREAMFLFGINFPQAHSDLSPYF